MKRIVGCLFVLIAAVGIAACTSGNASVGAVKQVISTTEAPTPAGPYSQGILFGNTLYCAGQIGIDPATGELVDGGIEAEANQALENLGAVLRAANMSYAHVVMASVFLRDINDYSALNEVYATYFANDPPARQAVEVGSIPGGANVEISVIAMTSSN